jgi:hypothetical protein
MPALGSRTYPPVRISAYQAPKGGKDDFVDLAAWIRMVALRVTEEKQ